MYWKWGSSPNLLACFWKDFGHTIQRNPAQRNIIHCNMRKIFIGKKFNHASMETQAAASSRPALFLVSTHAHQVREKRIRFICTQISVSFKDGYESFFHIVWHSFCISK
jgi:hypothetical protein